MNEIFSFHRELNIKKIVIIITIILVFLSISITIAIINNKKQKEIEDANPNSIFYDENNTISLTLSKNYGLKKFKSTDDYLIELRSENNLDIFVSFIKPVEGRYLSTIVSGDTRAFTEEFDGYSNLSELKEINVNDHLAYTYSFHYFDSNIKTTFYLQIIWIETENGYYILDIEFPLENLNNYSNIINDTLNSLIIYEKKMTWTIQ